MADAVNSIKIDPPATRETKEQLDRMEKKLDFVCDFIQYAKTGEVPQ
jgi:tetrahydromethanopterin S-methyltransferase subunit G